MGRGQRLGLVLAAVVVAVVAFVLLQPDDSDDDQGNTRNAVQETPDGEPVATVPGPGPDPRPEVVQIRIADGEVQGGGRRITVTRDEVARFEVRSDAPDEIHLHGYDVTKDVAPGSPARFRVRADAEGVFEIEAHDLGHVVVGTLVVEP